MTTRISNTTCYAAGTLLPVRLQVKQDIVASGTFGKRLFSTAAPEGQRVKHAAHLTRTPGAGEGPGRAPRGAWGGTGRRASEVSAPPYLGAPAAGCETSPRPWAGPRRHGPCPLPAAIPQRLASRRHLQHRTALSGLRPRAAPPPRPALPSPAGRRRCFSSRPGSRQSASPAAP